MLAQQKLVFVLPGIRVEKRVIINFSPFHTLTPAHTKMRMVKKVPEEEAYRTVLFPLPIFKANCKGWKMV
jgi:hypothetical protein